MPEVRLNVFQIRLANVGRIYGSGPAAEGRNVASAGSVRPLQRKFFEPSNEAKGSAFQKTKEGNRHGREG